MASTADRSPARVRKTGLWACSCWGRPWVCPEADAVAGSLGLRPLDCRAEARPVDCLSLEERALPCNALLLLLLEARARDSILAASLTDTACAWAFG